MKQKRLKVYGGTIPYGKDQKRLIVAAPTGKCAQEMLGIMQHEFRQYFRISKNDQDCAVCIEDPFQGYIQSGKRHATKRFYEPIPWQLRYYNDDRLGQIYDITLTKEAQHLAQRIEHYELMDAEDGADLKRLETVLHSMYLYRDRVQAEKERRK